MHPATLPTVALPELRELSAEDLWNLADDGMRYELVKGELRTMPPAGYEHGKIGSRLYGPMWTYVTTRNLGEVIAIETGFIVARDPDTVARADIAFVSQERIDRVGPTRKYFPESPDVAVEVVSPFDTIDAVDEKVQEWLRAGTRLVWVVKPRQKTVIVHRAGVQPVQLGVDDILDGQDVIPGFQIRVGEIFPT